MRKTEPQKTETISLDTTVITPEAFKTRMANIFYSAGKDVESCHGQMDDLMCELLRNLGYGEGIDIFEAAEKWYT